MVKVNIGQDGDNLEADIELIPWGIGDGRPLGKVEIINDGTGTATRGNYNVRLSRKGGGLWRTGRVENFSRQRLGAYDLLYRALRATVGERND